MLRKIQGHYTEKWGKVKSARYFTSWETLWKSDINLITEISCGV